jgi:hypothetical protein
MGYGRALAPESISSADVSCDVQQNFQSGQLHHVGVIAPLKRPSCFVDFQNTKDLAVSMKRRGPTFLYLVLL